MVIPLICSLAPQILQRLGDSNGTVRLFSEYKNQDLAYVDLHTIAGRVERVDQQHVKYLLDLQPAKKQAVQCSVTCKRRKVGPELNSEKKREP